MGNEFSYYQLIRGHSCASEQEKILTLWSKMIYRLTVVLRWFFSRTMHTILSSAVRRKARKRSNSWQNWNAGWRSANTDFALIPILPYLAHFVDTGRRLIYLVGRKKYPIGMRIWRNMAYLHI